MSDTRTLMQIVQDCMAQSVRHHALEAARRPPPKPPEPDPPRENDTIPTMHRWATLDAPELRQRVTRTLAIAEGKAALSAVGLMLVGPSGSGKTSLACALLRAWEERHEFGRAVFASAWRLGIARAHHGLGQGEAPDVGRAMGTGLLVLDDLGSERNSPTSAVPDVIFARAEAGLPTWVTTWMTAEAVAQRYGDGIARRLYEAGRVTVIGCGDHS